MLFSCKSNHKRIRNCCLLLMAWNSYLAITRDNFLFLSSVNLINGVLHASLRNVLARSQNKGHCVNKMLFIFKGHIPVLWNCHCIYANYLWAAHQVLSGCKLLESSIYQCPRYS